MNRIARGLLTLMLLGPAACGGAKPGDACSEPECDSASVAYACEGGSYREVPCRGPGGCTTDSPGGVIEIECDESSDVAGDQCSGEDVGSVICVSQPDALTCLSGTEVWTAVECPNSCNPGPSSIAVCQ